MNATIQKLLTEGLEVSEQDVQEGRSVVSTKVVRELGPDGVALSIRYRADRDRQDSPRLPCCNPVYILASIDKAECID